MRRLSLLAVVLVVLLSAIAANAGTILINFETVPALPTGPSTFGGPEQTIVVPGVATFSGGEVLGNATNFPAQSFATPPNIYGTAGFDIVLSETLTMTVDPAFGNVNEVSFPLFNGATQTESYTVSGFDGATLVATQNLSNLPGNLSSGFGIVDLLAPTITSVTITPDTLNATCCNGWDFAIDSVALNAPVQQFFVPEPPTFVLIGLGPAFGCILKLWSRFKLPLDQRSA